MWIRSDNFVDNGPIPSVCSFNKIDPEAHASFAPNRNPGLSWGEFPEETTSFVLMVIDIDVPTRGDDVNQEGRVVSEDLPRTDFTHWLLVDIPPNTQKIEEGAYSDGVVPRGKPGTFGPPHEGINDYTGWFEGDPDMAGTYHGYDGPCPPWNDSIIHRYEFRLVALDVSSLDLDREFTTDDVHAAIEGHVIDSATLTGTYTLNPSLV